MMYLIAGKLNYNLITQKSVHIPSESGRVFQRKLATRSKAKRPPIPTGRRPLFGPLLEEVAGIVRNEKGAEPTLGNL